MMDIEHKLRLLFARKAREGVTFVDAFEWFDKNKSGMISERGIFHLVDAFRALSNLLTVHRISEGACCTWVFCHHRRT